jgi:hypothetical protein
MTSENLVTCFQKFKNLLPLPGSLVLIDISSPAHSQNVYKLLSLTRENVINDPEIYTNVVI